MKRYLHEYNYVLNKFIENGFSEEDLLKKYNVKKCKDQIENLYMKNDVPYIHIFLMNWEEMLRTYLDSALFLLFYNKNVKEIGDKKSSILAENECKKFYNMTRDFFET